MKYHLSFGMAAVLASLVLIIDRQDLAGQRTTHDAIAILVRNEPRETRFLVVGSIIGWLGIITIAVGVMNLKESTPPEANP